MEAGIFTPRIKSSNTDHCAVSGCKSKACENLNLSFHRFPKPNTFVTTESGNSEEIDKLQAWKNALEINIINSHTRVCSLHFKKSDYLLPDFKAKRRDLKRNAIPSLNLPGKITNERIVVSEMENVDQETIGMRFSPHKSNSKTSCCVFGCKSYAKKDPTVRFHNIPKAGDGYVNFKTQFDEEEKVDRRWAWEQVLKINKNVGPNSKVCSLHFTKEDYILPDYPSQTKNLKKTAIPSVNLPETEIETETETETCEQIDKMVVPQEFNLRWNSHSTNILQILVEHLSSELLVDVTLSCQGQYIKAHKIILSACSSYFQEIFKSYSEKHPIIILSGINFTDLQLIVKFMYHGEIRISEEQLPDLLAAAETLQVKGLSHVRDKYEKGEINTLSLEEKLKQRNEKSAVEKMCLKSPKISSNTKAVTTCNENLTMDVKRTTSFENIKILKPVTAKTLKNLQKEKKLQVTCHDGNVSAQEKLKSTIDESSRNNHEEDVIETQDLESNFQIHARKRRKMLHTVNELAKETVFLSNEIEVPETNVEAENLTEEQGKTEILSELMKEPNDEQSATILIEARNALEKKEKARQTTINSASTEKGKRDIEPPRIPRPPNAFMVFANEWRKRLSNKYPSESNVDISIRLGALWKGLNVKAKEAYYKISKQLDEEHKIKYPHYIYNPRSKRNSKQLVLISPTVVDNEMGAYQFMEVQLNADDISRDDVTILQTSQLVENKNDSAVKSDSNAIEPE